MDRRHHPNRPDRGFNFYPDLRPRPTGAPLFRERKHKHQIGPILAKVS